MRLFTDDPGVVTYSYFTLYDEKVVGVITSKENPSVLEQQQYIEEVFRQAQTFCLKENVPISDLKIERVRSLTSSRNLSPAFADFAGEGDYNALLEEYLKFCADDDLDKIEKESNSYASSLKEAAFVAWLGFILSKLEQGMTIDDGKYPFFMDQHIKDGIRGAAQELAKKIDAPIGSPAEEPTESKAPRVSVKG